ncbi:aspartate carbamoyltransferase catalytic subunit [Pelagibacterales bacterium]|jgi:aspartate carbamoyltransferase catalytic subunit|nr:aspartate carbamoyltransferase catalytic subunit [Pelagibacterales bacterium]|tara:strand:+ start:714 stop:1652 length:939 start_codon:yes stop_codon:yes gene_type:complete
MIEINKIPKLSIKNLQSIKDLSVQDINSIINTAKLFKYNNKEKDKAVPILNGRTIINLFFEPSTRTLISFEIAAKRLGADIINMNLEGSSLRKGETISDTADTLNAMNPDLVIVRHATAGSINEISSKIKCPVISAGEGSIEHPTQALLDAFTMKDKGKNFKDLVVSICGDVEHSRVAKSNYYLLKKLDAKIRFVTPKYFKPKNIETFDVEYFDNLEKGIELADIVMMLRIQKERINDADLPSEDEYFNSFGLTYKKLLKAKKDVLVMHPGPINRNVEIESSLADDLNKSVINEQVENGVAVRMACLAMMVE